MRMPCNPLAERELYATLVFPVSGLVASGTIPVVIRDKVFFNKYSRVSPNGYHWLKTFLSISWYVGANPLI